MSDLFYQTFYIEHCDPLNFSGRDADVVLLYPFGF